MKIFCIGILSFILPHCLLAQEPNLLTKLDGDFQWRIIKPSEDRVTRTGIKNSRLEKDSTLLLVTEEFTDSEVTMTGLFGYNPKTNSYFQVNSYNIDRGPHVVYGKKIGENELLFESENEQSLLTIPNDNQHFWTYRRLKNDHWETIDLKIEFVRVDKP